MAHEKDTQEQKSSVLLSPVRKRKKSNVEQALDSKILPITHEPVIVVDIIVDIETRQSSQEQYARSTTSNISPSSNNQESFLTTDKKASGGLIFLGACLCACSPFCPPLLFAGIGLIASGVFNFLSDWIFGAGIMKKCFSKNTNDIKQNTTEHYEGTNTSKILASTAVVASQSNDNATTVPRAPTPPLATPNAKQIASGKRDQSEAKSNDICSTQHVVSSFPEDTSSSLLESIKLRPQLEQNQSSTGELLSHDLVGRSQPIKITKHSEKPYDRIPLNLSRLDHQDSLSFSLENQRSFLGDLLASPLSSLVVSPCDLEKHYLQEPAYCSG